MIDVQEPELSEYPLRFRAVEHAEPRRFGPMQLRAQQEPEERSTRDAACEMTPLSSPKQIVQVVQHEVTYLPRPVVETHNISIQAEQSDVEVESDHEVLTQEAGCQTTLTAALPLQRPAAAPPKMPVRDACVGHEPSAVKTAEIQTDSLPPAPPPIVASDPVDESVFERLAHDRELITHWFDQAQTSHLGLDHAINVALGLAETALKPNTDVPRPSEAKTSILPQSRSAASEAPFSLPSNIYARNTAIHEADWLSSARDGEEVVGLPEHLEHNMSEGLSS